MREMSSIYIPIPNRHGYIFGVSFLGRFVTCEVLKKTPWLSPARKRRSYKKRRNNFDVRSANFDRGREFIGVVVKDVMIPKLLWVLLRYCWRLVKDGGF